MLFAHDPACTRCAKNRLEHRRAVAGRCEAAHGNTWARGGLSINVYRQLSLSFSFYLDLSLSLSLFMYIYIYI